jgi:UDP-N-acetylmuramate--alanine ligase
MHIFFSGVSGAAMGPLSLIASQAGHHISGSDKQDSYYLDYLRKHGVSNVYVGQTREAIEAIHAKSPIDWYVYSSSVAIEQPNHPEFAFCHENNIKMSKRDELINKILFDNNLKLIAVAGTHGKTTTTAMVIWLFKELGIPLSYSVGAKLSFGEMGEFSPDSEFFAYECDEYDRNFLAFKPYMSLIAGIDWDHPDIFPTRAIYYEAFVDFINQSERAVLWDDDAERLAIAADERISVANTHNSAIDATGLPGLVNRKNAFLVALGVSALTGETLETILPIMARFPGVSRRFEKLADNLYSDYAHTPRKIEGALQLAHEVAGANVVVVYEGLHNTRQHFIKDELTHLFDSAKQTYIVPSYLAREDMSLALWSPTDIITLLAHPEKAAPAQLNDELWQAISDHQKNGDLILCLTAGGGNSLDEWLRTRVSAN